MDIRNLFSKFRLKLRNNTKGYVVLLLVVFVPLIMLGTKLALDLMTMHDTMINTRTSGPAYRKCAEKAALAVAQNWNPGRSLDHQKRAVLKVADQVYNDGVNSIGNIPELAKAVPGIQLSVNNEVIIGKGFDPIRVKTRAIPSTINQIKYLSAPKYLLLRKIYPTSWKNGSPWNLPFVAWKLVDKLTSADTTYDKFDELDQEEYKSGKYVLSHFDRYQHPHQWWVRADEGYPTRDYFSIPLESAMDVLCMLTSSNTSSTDESGYSASFAKNTTETNITYAIQSSIQDGTYTYREDENDNSVQVSVENDKIKVQTDYDVGYAIPAECNVDIVLACPVNGAACNINNRDQNSTAPEMPYTSGSYVDQINSDIKSCPIYQIGQAFRTFAKEFYHTKGVTMGLIPYSGKVSLDPDVANGYTVDWSRWNANYYFYQNGYIFQNAYQAYIRGRNLYGSYGMTDKELNSDYKWNTLLTACPIFCRTGLNFTEIYGANINEKYGGNYVLTGDILSNIKPYMRDGYSAHFYRQNSNPCYGGYANLLTMRCERNCTVYLPNPYYIIEPTADVQKIYEICGALYPFYDEYNVSNFLFIPITWANNLWQDWTRNPEHAAVDTDASGNGGQLSVPSKTTAGRKKVLILVVNKPDWFEPHELTYLGFDNDFSELCMIESDRIDFSQNYDDTSKKFADGSSYDGTIQGPKKILKVSSQSGISRNANSGYYECSSGSLTLSFPKKYLVKVVVETPDFKITNLGSELGASTSLSNWNQIASDGNKYIALNEQGYIAHSTDAKHWSNRQQMPSQWLKSIIYANDIWMIAGDGGIFTGDGNSWTNNGTIPSGYNAWYDFTYGNGIWFGTNFWFTRGYSNDNGVSWNHNQNTSAFFRSNFSVTYMNGLWFILDPGGGIKTNPGGELHTFPDDSRWTSIGNRLSSVPSSGWRRIRSGKKFLVALNDNGNVAYSRDNGNTWKYVSIGESSTWTGLNHIENDRFIACSNEGYTSLVEHASGTVVFANISSIPGTDKKEFTFEGRREFYIEPSQMNGNSIDISLKNIRLISAEITNRPYIKTTPICSFDGTNIKTNMKKSMTVKVNPPPSYGSITFYDYNKIEDNVGTHTITGQTTFNFSGPQIKESSYFASGRFSSLGKNFAHNLSKYKVRYSADNGVRITSATLTRQFLRDYGGHYNRGNDSAKQLIVSNGKLGERPSSWGIYIYPGCGTEESKTVENFRLCADSCIKLISGTENWAFFNGCADMSLDGTLKVYGLASTFYFWVWGGIGNSCITCNGTTISITESSRGKSFSPVSCSGTSSPFDADIQIGAYLNQYYIESKQNKSLLSTSIDTNGSQNSNIEQNKGIALQRLSSKISDQIVAGDYICFQGDGDLSITVEPTISSSTITHTTPTGSNITESYTGNPQTITIDPDNYKYEDDGKGNYTIKLTTNNVTLSDLQLVDTSDVFTWDKIRRPEMSRWIDYSTNPYTANLVSTDTQFLKHWKYSTETGFYRNTTVEGNWAVMYFEGIPGDYSSITYSDSNYEIRHYRQGENDSDGTYGTYNPYPASGLNLLYTPLYMVHNDMLKNGKFSWSKYVGTANTFNLVLQTLTLPINTALYYAYHDNSTNEAEWYTNSKGEYEYDASEASKNVTKAACTKLKNDFGNNLRIYLIKYRKQTQYKHKVTSASTEYKYDYLDDCTAYKYDITDEDELKTTMKTIAADIRTFAEYKGAVNVVP